MKSECILCLVLLYCCHRWIGNIFSEVLCLENTRQWTVPKIMVMLMSMLHNESCIVDIFYLALFSCVLFVIECLVLLCLCLVSVKLYHFRYYESVCTECRLFSFNHVVVMGRFFLQGIMLQNSWTISELLVCMQYCGTQNFHKCRYPIGLRTLQDGRKKWPEHWNYCRVWN